MKIQVRYFAVLRERIGASEETLELDSGARVEQAIDLLGERHPAIAQMRGAFRPAVNRAMTDGEAELRDGDELALIPPVAGGNDRPGPADDLPYARIVSDRALSLDRVVAAVTAAEIGAAVTFTGTVRRHSRGREVVKLAYEAYVEMAESVLSDLCREISAEIEGSRVAVEHRTGTLAVGEIAVVIAAAAPHRDEAFRACRAMIERLKQRVPIWKKEFGVDGAEWVGVGP